jgi:hypothetical protein
MSTAEQTTSKLAKNWPSTVFWGMRPQVAEVQIPLYFQGFSWWWAQRDLNPRPSDYESPALTAELWAHGFELQGFRMNRKQGWLGFDTLYAAKSPVSNFPTRSIREILRPSKNQGQAYSRIPAFVSGFVSMTDARQAPHKSFNGLQVAPDAAKREPSQLRLGTLGAGGVVVAAHLSGEGVRFDLSGAVSR